MPYHSGAEDRLYGSRIKQLQGENPGDLNSVWEKTTCFSSLSLLWDLKQCEALDFEVTGSADGAANTVANDFKILNFGCFSINKKGIRSFRPFIYLLFPAEVEIYFAIV